MNRRDLIKKLGLGVPAILVSQGSLSDSLVKPPSTPDRFMFHGWLLHWTGWKRIVNMDVQVCQWVAFDKTVGGLSLYSSWPGSTQGFFEGQVFNLAQLDDQILPRFNTSEETLAWCKNECLERLKRMIIKVGPPPLDYEKWRGKL